jgi:hypothetical protein
MKSSKKNYWLDHRHNVDKVFYTLCAFCAVVLLADFFYRKHAQLPWEEWFGFYAFYGFVACISLVLIAKQLRKILMRKEDYYDH